MFEGKNLPGPQQMTWGKSPLASRLEGLVELPIYFRKLLADDASLPPKRFELATLGFLYLNVGMHILDIYIHHSYDLS